ncbi:MAG TPA: biotin/lipoyl-containing protein [Bacteroidota bacterium]|nr:biotin/lipoyl-containing protein [Bacteroidota bacterium]
MKHPSTSYRLSINGIKLKIDFQSPGLLLFRGKSIRAALTSQKNGLYRVKVGDKYSNVYIERLKDNHYQVWLKHFVLRVKLEDERDALIARFETKAIRKSEETIRAPMPGIVTRIIVAAGGMIARGSGVLLLEAMKMENEIRSPIDGKIKTIAVKENTPVEKDQALIVVEPS